MLNGGIKSLAVVFKHAAIFPEHEEAVGKVARELGFEQVKQMQGMLTKDVGAFMSPEVDLQGCYEVLAEL